MPGVLERTALAALIEERLGIELGAWNEAEVRALLGRGGPGPRTEADAVAALRADPAELAAWAGALTAGETCFFRHAEQLRGFADVVLPAALARGRRPVRVLSVGCATGEEAYSLALLARERLGDQAPREVSILGIDINPEAIRRARLARFPDRALWQLPSPAYRALFRRAGREWTLPPELGRGVAFEVRNAMDADPAFWAPGSFDVVLCRNVLIYFAAGARRRMLERLAGTLAPGGCLLLGPADVLRGMPPMLAPGAVPGAFHAREGGR